MRTSRGSKGKNDCPGHIRAALNRLVEAAREDAFKGAAEPDVRELIEAELRLQRYRVEVMIGRAIKQGARNTPPS